MTQPRRHIATPGKKFLQGNAGGSVQFYRTDTVRIEKGNQYQLIVAPPLVDGANYQRMINWHWGCHPTAGAPLPCLGSWPGNDTCPICEAIEKIARDTGQRSDELNKLKANPKAYVNAFNRLEVRHKGVPLIQAFHIWELAMKGIRPLRDQMLNDIGSLHPTNAVALQVKRVDPPSGFTDYPASILTDNEKYDAELGAYLPLREPWVYNLGPQGEKIADWDQINAALDSLPDLETHFQYPDQDCIREMQRAADNLLGQFIGHIPPPEPGAAVPLMPGGTKPNPTGAAATSQVGQGSPTPTPPAPPNGQGTSAGVSLPPEVDGAQFPCYGGNNPHRETGKSGFDKMLLKCLRCPHQAPCMASFQEGDVK